MIDEDFVLTEFSLRTMAALAVAGSEVAAGYVAKTAPINGADCSLRALQSAAWRTSVARSLGLVSDKFALDVVTAFHQIQRNDQNLPLSSGILQIDWPPFKKSSQANWPLLEHLLQKVQPPLEVEEQEAQRTEARRMLGGFISLDEEYLSDISLQLLSLHICAVNDLQSTARVHSINGRSDATAHVQGLCAQFPEEIVSLVQLADDVSSFVETFIETYDFSNVVTTITSQRFVEVLIASRILKEFTRSEDQLLTTFQSIGRPEPDSHNELS